jgi:succinoglycan biosynthesis protein ExoA
MANLSVVVAVPVLNEEKYIEACLKSLLPQIDEARSSVFVIDGGSTDRTTEIVRSLQRQHSSIVVLDNPKRNQAAAMNLAARRMACDVDVLVRADAHSIYPDTFVSTCVEALRLHKATSVVVPMKTVGLGPIQRAIAHVQNARIGNGGSAHRVSGVSRYVDHGHHAAFDAEFFRRLGGYNENFWFNEDAEFDFRSHRNGGAIWLCVEATIIYYPRKTLANLARQYFNFGTGRAKTILTHNVRPKLRQLAPVLLLLALLMSVFLSVAFPVLLTVPAAILLLYAGYSLVTALATRDPAMLASGPAACVMHIGWAAGFLSTSLLAGVGRRGDERSLRPIESELG